MSSNGMPELMDKKELAKALCVSHFTIDQWVSQRRIPFRKLLNKRVVFDVAEIRAWLDAQRREPNPAK